MYGDFIVRDIEVKDIVRTQGSYKLVKSSQQNKYCVYRSNEYGYYDLVKEGSLTQCSIYMDGLWCSYIL